MKTETFKNLYRDEMGIGSNYARTEIIYCVLFPRNGACLLTLHFQLKCEMTQSKVSIGLIICGMKTKSNNLLLKTAAEYLNYSSIPIIPNLCMHLAANNLLAI